MRAIAVAIVAAALALAAPLAAHAAGLGRITVFSPLGQPLNAEIEIVALAPGEEDTLVARIASPEAFAQAGIDLSPALIGMRFNIERRDGRRVLRVSTSQAINEPFVELLVELQWNTGRLVREYTFLLDPPEYKSRETVAAAQMAPKPAAPAAEMKPAPPVEAKPLEPAAPPPQVITPTPAPTTAETPAAAPPAAREPPAREEPAREPAREAAQEPAKDAAKPSAEAKVHEVVKGDTLGAIARANLPPGITLNQMLVAIYRANQDAFIRENVNLVRAGRILNIPAAEAIGTIDAEEANRVVRAHMAEFREYRSRLAAVAVPADATPGQRESTGKIEPKPAAPKPQAQDQVRLSKVEPQKPGATAAARGDDAVARERALQEAQSRIKDLEKNVADLQKLLELKNQQLAELQRRAAEKPSAAPAAPAPAPKAPEKPAVAEPAKPAAPAPAPVAKAPEKPAAEPAKPAPAPEKPAAAPPKEAPKEAPKPAPAPAKPVAKPAPPPPPERSTLDEVLEFVQEPTGMLVVLVLVLGLGGYGYWAWRKKKAAQAKFHDSVMGAAAAGAAAGAAVAEPTMAPTSTSAPAAQPSGAPAAMAAEEVDPIAEADVYMAYGRDAQAEEILKEALQKDSNRTAVHAKLLEIYANRKDPKAFEQAALKVKNLTNGTGPEWDKAAALGRSIDPQNGLYAGAAGAVAAAPAAAAAPSAPAPTLDFDIGGAAQASASAPDITLDAAPKEATASTGIDFDISGATATQKIEPAPKPAGGGSPDEKSTGALDFNLDLGATQRLPDSPPPAPAAAAPAADAGLTFDLNLDLGGDKKAEPAAPAPAAASDLGSISLDLDSPGTPAAAPAGADPKWQEIATKLDLAKAYEEMGDKAGAKELLNEVMKDGDAAQKGQAQQLLAKLG